MHRFLMVVAEHAGALRCPINVVKSLQEVIRVTSDEVALMLMKGDTLIGTMGIINPVWWYGDEGFLTDRWHFVLPAHDSTPAAAMLEDEAVAIANGAGLEFIHQGRLRRGKKGVMRNRPRVYEPESTIEVNGG